MNKNFNSPEEHQIEDPQYWINKIIHYFDLVDINQKNTRRIDLNIFKYAPQSILFNHDVMIEAINKNFISYVLLDKKLTDNKDFVLKYAKEVKYAYFFLICDELKADEDIFKAFIEKDSTVYQSVYRVKDLYHKYSTVEGIKELLQLNPKVYKYLPKKIKEDINIASLVVELDIDCVDLISKRLTSKIFNNNQINDILLGYKIQHFDKINNKFRDNEDFLLPWLKKNPSLIKFISPRLLAKKDFIKYAASSYDFLSYIPNELKKEESIIRAHLESYPYHYSEVEQYIDIKPIMIELIKKNPKVYTDINEEMKLDDDYIYAVLYHETYYHKNYAKEILNILPTSLYASLDKETREFKKNSSFITYAEILSFARSKYNKLFFDKYLKEKTKIKTVKI